VSKGALVTDSVKKVYKIYKKNNQSSASTHKSSVETAKEETA
jgi:hypothetical protein